jgi:hypothetical protein
MVSAIFRAWFERLLLRTKADTSVRQYKVTARVSDVSCVCTRPHPRKHTELVDAGNLNEVAGLRLEERKETFRAVWSERESM